MFIQKYDWCDTRTQINIQWKQEIPKVSAAQSCENQLKISLIISCMCLQSASVVRQLFVLLYYCAQTCLKLAAGE